jgi:capsular exopolysaccharide synthesis family protein
MSRIHDALKKAAQERTARVVTSNQMEIVDVAEDVQRTNDKIEGPPEREMSGVFTAEEAAFRNFEDLIKRCPRQSWQPTEQTLLFQNAADEGPGAERFHTLRSRLSQIAAVRPLRRVLVTSSVPEEGKTFVAANLAKSIARQPDKRVLLIDADLRASRLHRMLGAPETPGLTDYLRGELDVRKIIQRGPEGNLCFIPGGNDVTNPGDLLLNERMKKLLEGVTPLFDWVILDSPPALPVHDASLIADLCDGVLFVVKAGATNFEIAEKASAEFRQKNLIGVVLNRVQSDSEYHGYYYGHEFTKG